MAKAIICASGGGDIDVSNLTASPQDVLDGKTFYGTGSEEPQAGTMVNNGTIKELIPAGEIYIVPEGYHSGTGSVMAEGLHVQTEGTATEKDILYGETAWVNGWKITGEMPKHPGGETTLKCSEVYTVDSGYHDRRVITAQDLASQTAGTAAAGDILSGKTAWVGGNKKTGTIPSKGAATYTPSKSVQTIAAGQYLSGAQTIAALPLDMKDKIISWTKTIPKNGTARYTFAENELEIPNSHYRMYEVYITFGDGVKYRYDFNFYGQYSSDIMFRRWIGHNWKVEGCLDMWNPYGSDFLEITYEQSDSGNDAKPTITQIHCFYW